MGTFSDFKIAADLRDVIERIATGVVEKVRPEPFLAKVYSVDIFSQTAQVLTPGQLIDSLITVQFGLDKIPSVTMSTTFATLDYDAPGDIVRVAGKSGGYFILDFVSGSPFVQGDETLSALHSNPSFEGQYTSTGNYPSGWSSFWNTGTWTANPDSADKVDGYQALKIVRSPSSAVRVHGQNHFTVSPGESITISIYAKASTAVGMMEMSMFTHDAGGSADFFAGATQHITLTALTSIWTKYSTTFTVPATHVKARLTFRLYTSDDTLATFWVDYSHSERPPIEQAQLIYARKSQDVLSGGGGRNVSISGGTTYIYWSTRIMAMGVGVNPAIAPLGYFPIAFPTVGTVIPVYAKTGTTSITTSASGLQLADWDTLWYELPISGGAGGFRIINWNGPNFTAPEHWVFIATRNADVGTLSGHVRWFDGLTDSGWVEPAFNAGNNYGGNEVLWGWRRMNGIMYFKGTIAVAAGTAWHYLAAGNRPMNSAGSALQQTIGSNLGAINLLIRHSDGAMYFPSHAPAYAFVSEIRPYPAIASG